MPTLTPKKSHVDLCYKCNCGCEHWMDSRWLQAGYELQCYCGKILNIKPTRVELRFVTANSPEKIRPSSKIKTKLKQVLKRQGFSVAEAKIMTDSIEIDTEDIGVLIKRALNTVETQ